MNKWTKFKSKPEMLMLQSDDAFTAIWEVIFSGFFFFYFTHKQIYKGLKTGGLLQLLQITRWPRLRWSRVPWMEGFVTAAYWSYYERGGTIWTFQSFGFPPWRQMSLRRLDGMLVSLMNLFIILPNNRLRWACGKNDDRRRRLKKEEDIWVRRHR